MHGADSIILEFILVMLIALIVLLVFYWVKQPSVVAYIIAGAIAGPYALGVITDASLIETLGEFGVVILLFLLVLKCLCRH